ncbi:hypothetical protein [Streptomyces sp. V2I9]|uniref:hypothetical protein n=1 Tax=Streptomyces sp. V2I9 TaxID=3042304 RepID=UPI0035937665
MDMWREDKTTGHTHEPGDATLRLDGLGRRLAELPGGPSPADGSDGPVFVDESGRRSKTLRRIGWVLAVGCAAYAVTLVLAVLGGNSSAPWLPVSGPEEKARAEQVEDVPAPEATGELPGEAAGPAPGASDPAVPDASGDPGAAPSATSVLVPAGSAKDPSASRPAAPAATTGGETGPGTGPAPTTSAAEPPAEPPPSPAPEPTAPTVPPAETPDPPVEEESAP